MQNARSKTPQGQMSEERAVHLVRNALLVAGQEMGEDGDHWPVIKSTIHSVMKDYEDLKVERNVDAELKKHLYAQLAEMETGIKESTPDIKADVEPKLRQLREIYDAYFTEANEANSQFDDELLPTYLKRAKTIIDTLEDENA